MGHVILEIQYIFFNGQPCHPLAAADSLCNWIPFRESVFLQQRGALSAPKVSVPKLRNTFFFGVLLEI